MSTYTIINAPQRSLDWFAARAGRVTGSRAKDMLATIKSGEAAARRDLRAQLVCERLTKQSQEDCYINADMQRGIDLEGEARTAYMSLTGHTVHETGFIARTDIMAGCSLDGHVNDMEGIVEIKCPRSATHLKYLRNGGIPSDHVGQIVHNMYVTGAKWCEFVSYDNRFPVPLQVFRVVLSSTDVDFVGYERSLMAFLNEVDADVDELMGKLAVAS